jgi:hypothetical protein
MEDDGTEPKPVKAEPEDDDFDATFDDFLKSLSGEFVVIKHLFPSNQCLWLFSCQ